MQDAGKPCGLKDQIGEKGANEHPGAARPYCVSARFFTGRSLDPAGDGRAR
jgi:hypothetical protein